MKVDKNLKQTFRLLEKVVRETELRAGPFSESGDVILFRIPLYKACVDVRD